MAHQNTQRFQRCCIHIAILVGKPAQHRLPVQITRRGADTGQLIKSAMAVQPSQFSEQGRIRLTVGGGTQPHIHAIHRPLLLQVKRPRPVSHAHQQQRFVGYSDGLDFGHHGRRNAVGDQAGQPLFFNQYIIHPDNRTIISSTNDQRPASRIGKRHQRSQHRLRRRQVPLEFERLAFGKGE